VQVLKAMIDIAPTQTQQWLYGVLLSHEFATLGTLSISLSRFPCCSWADGWLADDTAKTRFCQNLLGARAETGATDATKAFVESARRYQRAQGIQR
jgi:hypothetical protein